MTTLRQSGAQLGLFKLQPSQYKQVAEWAHGPQPNADWDDYARYMDGLITFGIYSGTELVGCVFLDRLNRTTIEYHIATARRRIHPAALAQVLLKSARFFFQRGITSLVAHIPKSNVAASRLALRCGMREYEKTDSERRFILSRGLNDA